MIENGVELTFDRTEELLKAIESLTKKQVMVGIPSTTAGRSGEITNAVLGYIHEYGSPARNIPARPWLLPPVNRLQDQAVRMLRNAAELVTDGKPAEADKQLEALGMFAVNAVKSNLVAGGDPPFAPNAPSTIARKGSDKPLIDTAQLLNAVSYVVRDKS